MAGGAIGSMGGNAPQGGGNTAQSLSHLQTLLSQLGGGGSGQGIPNNMNPLTSLGTNMMKQGMQSPTPPPQALARPMIGNSGPGVPVPQGATPNMGGGQGMPIGLMNMALARQNGMF